MASAPLSFQRDVDSLIRGKKDKSKIREPENPIRYAYMKLLREKDETRRVLPVDPYVEVYTLRKGIYGIYEESLDGMGDVWLFLIEGPEKGLLIDTGFGIGDLKGLCETLLGGKPYFVVNTHCHPDHALGNNQFDKVYCHEFEVPKLQKNMTPKAWDRLFDENGKGVAYDMTRDDMIPYRPYEIVGMPDGAVFDLGGGHEIELVFLPGHSSGHCGFLDKKNRIFFPGDDCCVGAVAVGAGPPNAPYAEYGTVEALYHELLKIIARESEFDSLFPSHGPLETGPAMLSSVAEACKAVLDNPSGYDYRNESPFGVRLGKMIYESGYLLYTSRSVYMDREAAIN